MSLVLPFEPQIMFFIQGFANKTLDTVFKGVTALGEELFITAFIAFIYWCVDKRAGEAIGFVTLFSMTVNSALKNVFKLTRPIGYSGIRTDASAAARVRVSSSPTGYGYSYSMPSGHSQNAAAAYLTAAKSLHRAWFTILSFVVVAAVGISRLYLGVHWPKDVVVGWLLGAFFSVLFYRLISKKGGKNRLGVYVIFTVIMGAVGIFLVKDTGIYRTLGLMVGLVVSVAFETTFVNFDIKNVRWWKRLVRFILGLALLIGLYMGLGSVMPATNLFVFLRYFLTVFVSLGVYPVFFKLLGF